MVSDKYVQLLSIKNKFKLFLKGKSKRREGKEIIKCILTTALPCLTSPLAPPIRTPGQNIFYLDNLPGTDDLQGRSCFVYSNHIQYLNLNFLRMTFTLLFPKLK
jgi:hypothetical protein